MNTRCNFVRSSYPRIFIAEAFRKKPSQLGLSLLEGMFAIDSKQFKQLLRTIEKTALSFTPGATVLWSFPDVSRTRNGPWLLNTL